jgi:D-tyrosyl-tRNA(Tyr) deacylase
MTGHKSKGKTKEEYFDHIGSQEGTWKLKCTFKVVISTTNTSQDKRPSTTFASPLPQCSEPNQRVPMD